MRINCLSSEDAPWEPAPHAALGHESQIFSPARLAAVYATGLLDTPAEDIFDDFTRLASMMTNAPLAFATFVDDQRSFWKSAFGLPKDAPTQNPVGESFCQYVVNSRAELIIPDATLDSRTKHNPSIAAMGVRAWAGFPITSADNEVLGSFCVVDTEVHEWRPQDIDALRILAACVSREVAMRALLIDERRARLQSEALSQTLQATLLPPSLPDIPGLELAAVYRPAGRGIDVVGDFYDVFQVGEAQWSFILGDVCGKGVEAAKVAAFARYSVAASAVGGREPAEVLVRLNNLLLARDLPPGMFLTAIFGNIVPTDNAFEVTLACGGHHPPLKVSASGDVIHVNVEGPLIGVLPELALRPLTLRLGHGDSLVLFTDGVNEARSNAVTLDEAMITEVVRSSSSSAQAIADNLRDLVVNYSGGVSADDIAIVVLRCP